jgi:hypothetical protein
LPNITQLEPCSLDSKSTLALQSTETSPCPCVRIVGDSRSAPVGGPHGFLKHTGVLFRDALGRGCFGFHGDRVTASSASDGGGWAFQGYDDHVFTQPALPQSVLDDRTEVQALRSSISKGNGLESGASEFCLF